MLETLTLNSDTPLMARITNITEQLRRAVRQAERRGMSRWAIAKGAGVHVSQLRRIMDEGQIPRLDTAERLCAALHKTIRIEGLR